MLAVIARIALVAILLGAVLVAVFNHATCAPRRIINAWHVSAAVAAEAILIGLAGGWGTWG